MGMITILNAASVHETALPFRDPSDCACKFWLVCDATWTELSSRRAFAVLSIVDCVAYIGATVNGVHFNRGSFGSCPGAQIGGCCDDGNDANGVFDGYGASGASDGTWSYWIDDPEYGGMSGGAIVTILVVGYGAKGVLPSLDIGCMGYEAKGVLPSLDIGWIGLFTTVVGNTDTGVTAAPESVAPITGVATGTGTADPATGVTGVAASGVDGASGDGFTAAGAAAVEDDSPGFCSPLLMTMTFSPLGFNAPYRARPPTPAIRALWIY